MKKLFALFVLSFFVLTSLYCQEEPYQWQGKFEQLGQELPTPNVYRAADGTPGPEYWQQKADYDISVTLDDERQRISGQQTVTYYNHSPHTIQYIWIQLEQNLRQEDSDKNLIKNYKLPDSTPAKLFVYHMNLRSDDCGMNLTNVEDKSGRPLNYQMRKTMMRIDLEEPLEPNNKFEFKMSWWYNLNNRMEDYGRSGYEYFPEDENYLYTIAQFYPRVAVYDDYEGWQQKQFVGGGEFALTFGDFDVKITVPEDHVVGATGELQNAKKVLSKEEWKRWKSASKSFDKPVWIVTETEARVKETQRSNRYVTWHYKASNVRDFAFASSRKFIWDAQSVTLGGKKIMAMSLYPKEGNPLWEKESTKAIINTLKTYSKYTIDYPYPTAISVHAASIGMEYPMICFNFGRPESDGSYTTATKFGMIGVIIHEVGHNFFPMIVNSDERQWTWMDEGLNSFLEYITQKECYENYPFDKGPPSTIIPYMKGDKKYIRPIMTNSEQVVQLGPNAYAKPATALNILRESVMGKDLFDKAFKTYAQRWAFKHPKPADFFRTMEDASGIDLDWFWRGWFYSVDHVDIAIDTVVSHTTAMQNLEQNKMKEFKLTRTPLPYYGEFREKIDEGKMKEEWSNKYFYTVTFKNKGGLVMPLILDFHLDNGDIVEKRIPAEVWRMMEYTASKVFYFDRPVSRIVLDPRLETADVDTSNNSYLLISEDE